MKRIDLQRICYCYGTPEDPANSPRLGLSFRFLICTTRRDDHRRDRRTAPPSVVLSLLRAYHKPSRPSVSLRREAQTLSRARPTFASTPSPLPPRICPTQPIYPHIAMIPMSATADAGLLGFHLYVILYSIMWHRLLIAVWVV